MRGTADCTKAVRMLMESRVPMIRSITISAQLKLMRGKLKGSSFVGNYMPFVFMPNILYKINYLRVTLMGQWSEPRYSGWILASVRRLRSSGEARK